MMKKKFLWSLIGGLIFLLFYSSCNKMDENYKGYFNGGEIIYPVFSVHPGDNRILLKWSIMSDSLDKIKVVWTSKDVSDSIEKNVERITVDNSDTMRFFIENIKEGSYKFHLTTFSSSKNKIIDFYFRSKIYGRTFESTLFSRLPLTAEFAFDTLRISWEPPTLPSAIGTLISFIDNTGKYRDTIINSDSSELFVLDYDPQKNNSLFKFATLFKPEKNAIDTFYAKFDSSKITIPPVVADGHIYKSIFADNALDPHYLYFTGYPRKDTLLRIWKYDLIGDSLLAGYPKAFEQEFDLPYQNELKIDEVSSIIWLFMRSTEPNLQSYVIGNGHYYLFNMKTKEYGSLLNLDKLANQNSWPGLIPKDLFGAIYTPARSSNYLFGGKFYEKLSLSTSPAFTYWPNAKVINSVWKGVPSEFQDRGFSGLYYVERTRFLRFFSKDEFVIHNEASLSTPGKPEKISKFYKGL